MSRADFRRPGALGGRRAGAGPLVLHVVSRAAQPADGREADGVRVGFAVGRPVGGAVQRNRVRRRLRAAASSALPLARGSGASRSGGRTLVVVRARPGAESLGVADLTALIAQAWRRLDVRRGIRS